MENVYLNQVKKRLQLCCQESGLTLAKIHQACREEISYPSLRNLINGDALPTNLSHVKTICDAVGANLSEVLRADGAAIPEGGLSVLADGNVSSGLSGTGSQEVPVSESVSEACPSGVEMKNQTNYHCYLHAGTGSADELQHGILSINLPEDKANSSQNIAKLLLKNPDYEYTGIYFLNGEALQLVLQDSNKEMITISFLPPGGHSSGSKGILVKRDACSGAPKAQNILLFKEDLFVEKSISGIKPATVVDLSGNPVKGNEAAASLPSCLMGALKMIQQYAYLSSDVLEQAKAKDTELAAFLDEYGFLLKDMGHMVRLKPDLMLSALDERDIEGRKKAVRSILKLQQLSVNEDTYVYGDKQTIL